MKKIKTRRFRKAFYGSLGFSAVFLLWMSLFGKELAVQYFDGILGCLCAVFGGAALSFVVFCFVPYFHGDKRWFSISAVLTLAFFAGTCMLWQIPLGGMAV